MIPCVSGRPVPGVAVKEVIVSTKTKKSFHVPLKDLLLITGGATLVTGGLT